MENFPHMCLGDTDASYVCINQTCNYKVPLLCNNFKNCICNDHNHQNKEQIIKIKEFCEKYKALQPKSIYTMQKTLKSRLQAIKTELNLSIKQQEEKVDLFIDNLNRKYSKAPKNIRTYKDIQDRTGKQLNQLLKFKPQQVNLPQSLVNRVVQTLYDLNSQLIIFKTTLSKLIPMEEVIDIKSEICSRIDTKYNQLSYSQQAAPLVEILTPELSTISVLTLEKAIPDLSLVQAFKGFNSTSLKILSLSKKLLIVDQNNLGDEQIKFITEAKLPNLIEFKAFINRISDKGADYICKANWPLLGYFNLHSNQITTEGASRLVTRYSPNLFRFDLDYNKIEDDILQAMISLKWPKLTEVHLDGNQFSVKTRQSLDHFFRNKWRVQRLFILSTY